MEKKFEEFAELLQSRWSKSFCLNMETWKHANTIEVCTRYRISICYISGIVEIFDFSTFEDFTEFISWLLEGDFDAPTNP